MPALTRPTILSPSRIGVTTRIEGPSVPVYVSENVSPRRARAVCPRKLSPIRSAFGCVQRTRCGSMMVTKAIPVSLRTCSAYG